MTNPKLAYKRDTGFDATFYVESEVMDSSCTRCDACHVDCFPIEYVIDNDVYVPDPSYVRWLEEKYEELIQLKEK
jgi:hypothetical protein